jgi:hypothetical protein
MPDKSPSSLYERAVIGHPLIFGMLFVLLMAMSGYYALDFRLDASADSLILQNDEGLAFYREVSERYGADDFLIVTYAPHGPLFREPALDNLQRLQNELAGLDGVAGVTSILNVPLIASPPVTLSDLQKDIPTLQDPRTRMTLAREEFLTSPLYRDMLLSEDGETTAIQITLERDARYHALLERRNNLRAQQRQGGLSDAETAQLRQVEQTFDVYAGKLQARQSRLIDRIRAILADYRTDARIHLGGVPMIAADMVDFVRKDIQLFGAGVGILLLLLLAAIFRRVRWVVVPAVICATVALSMFGFLGAMGWHVTVVSSNFISLVLILTLSLIVHLIVRQLEHHAQQPTADQHSLLRATLRNKFAPSLFTTLTTMVSFASLIVSDIQPVIDFGYMMACGVAIAFALVFLMYPVLLAPLKAGAPAVGRHQRTAEFTRGIASIVARFRGTTWLIYAVIVVVGVAGVMRLSVENRFIDYFKPSTEIYQGMRLIDRELGGTTPLDVVLDPPAWFDEEDALEGDSIIATSYFFNSFMLEDLAPIHDYLDSLPETGKVLSIVTSMRMMEQVNGGQPLDSFSLALIYQRLPEPIKAQLIAPYMADDGNQVRFSIRVIDSADNLNRDALLAKIRHDLVQRFNLEPRQVHLSGMLVLYNNVVQSLFRSQILTLGVVFAAIAAMLLLLFRSPVVALIGVLPTSTAAVATLGLMGWLGIPLDIMTITIAAVTVGIGVDDSIHYIHRYREEIAVDGNHWAAAKRAHASAGRALFYTSVTVTLGFSILVLSNFMPTIYFGVLTGLAMILALAANLTLLPLLLTRFRVFA